MFFRKKGVADISGSKDLPCAYCNNALTGEVAYDTRNNRVYHPGLCQLFGNATSAFNTGEQQIAEFEMMGAEAARERIQKAPA